MKHWINGRLVSDDAAVVSVLDHGFTVGDGVFESAKLVDGVPFALTRHLDRLSVSATLLGLLAPDLDLVRAAVAETIEANRDEVGPLGRLRITYTDGPGPLGTDRKTARPTLVVAVGPQRPWAPSAALVSVPWTRNENGATAGIKSTSYAENIIALAYAKDHGADEAVFANTKGDLCEGTGSNIVVVVDGVAMTPSLRSGCLSGVTRALLVEWCGVEEHDLPLSVLERTDEVFLASSTRDVQPVHAVDGRRIDVPGPVTVRIAAEFAECCAREMDP